MLPSRISTRELLDLIKRYKDKFSGDEVTEDIAALLVGAGFSLWRAVFLAPKDPTSRFDILKKGRSYYLNNTRFRLFHVKKLQSGTDDGPPRSGHGNWKGMGKAHRRF